MRKAVAKLAVLKLLGAGLGLAYSVSQATVFGATAQMDAYFVAVVGVSMITSLVQGGQLAEVFVPEYLKAKHSRSMHEASLLFSAVVTRMLVAVLTLSLTAAVAAPALIDLLGPGLASAEKALAADMFRWAAGLAALTLFSSFVNTTLNAEGVFGRAEATGAISQLISLSLLWTFHAKAGVWVLIYSQTIGALVELASGTWFLLRKGIIFRPAWSAPEHDLSRFFRVLYATTGYVAATQLVSTTVTACASMLPPGSLSVFTYARLYCNKLSALLLGPLNTVLFSKLANIAAKGESSLAKSLTIPIRVTLLLTCAVVGCAWLAGVPILGLMLRNSSFDAGKLQLAHEILTWGFIGGVVSGVGMLFRRAAISLGQGRKLYLQWTFIQLVSVAASYLFLTELGEKGLVWIMPFNMTLMAWVSIKVSAEAGTNLREALGSRPWDRPWRLLAVGVGALPLAIMALPLGGAVGELAAAIIRLALYLIPLAALSAFLWMPRGARTR